MHLQPTVARLFLFVALLWAAPVSAQQAPVGWPAGVSVPVFVIPASAMNGAGVVTCPQGIATTSTDCVLVANNTAATSGVPVQMAPRVRFRGNVWNTTATAANNTDDWFIDPLPVSGATPSSLWRLGSSLNGAAATYPFQGTSAGSWQVGDGTAAAPSLTFASQTGLGLFRHSSNYLGVMSPAYSVSLAMLGIGAGAVKFPSGGYIHFSSTTDAMGTADTFLGRGGAAATLQLGVSTAGVTNQMFKGPDRITSDGVGGNLTIAGGRNRGASVGGSVIFQTSPPAGAGVTGTLATRQTIDPVGGIVHGVGDAGAATTSYRLPPKKVTAIADNTATDVLTVTVPNGNHAASLKLTFTSSNGGTDAFESTRTSYGQIAIARTTGVNVVGVAAALDSTAIATVAGGATHTFAYGVSAIAGAVDATNTFTVTVTVDDSGNLGSNQCVVLAELINAEATGITVQ